MLHQVNSGQVLTLSGTFYCSEAQQRLIQLEDAAKSAGIGRWGSTSSNDTIRDIKWNVEEPRKLVDSKHSKPVKGMCGRIDVWNLSFWFHFHKKSDYRLLKDVIQEAVAWLVRFLLYTFCSQ